MARPKKTVAIALQSKSEQLKDNPENSSKKMKNSSDSEILIKAYSQKPDELVNHLANVKMSAANVIDHISNRLTEEIQRLKTVQQAIEIEESNLLEMHAITKQANTLEALIQTNAQEAEDFEKEMAEIKKTWAQQKEEHDKWNKDYLNQLKQARDRDAETYNYELAKSRRIEQDKYEAEKQAKTKQWQESFARFEVELNERSKKLTEQETLFQTTQAELAALKESAKAETEKAVAIATNSLKKELTHTFELERMKLQNEIQLKVSDYSFAQKRVEELLKLNAELDAKYKQATDKVQQIAEKAIDGASKQSHILTFPNSESKSERSSPR